MPLACLSRCAQSSSPLPCHLHRRRRSAVGAPWKVERVEMSASQVRVDVHLEHDAGAQFACPQCGVELSVYDHGEERAC